MFNVLRKLLKYDYDIMISVSLKEFKEACQKEIRRIQSIKNK